MPCENQHSGQKEHTCKTHNEIPDLIHDGIYCREGERRQCGLSVLSKVTTFVVLKWLKLATPRLQDGHLILYTMVAPPLCFVLQLSHFSINQVKKFAKLMKMEINENGILHTAGKCFTSIFSKLSLICIHYANKLGK